MNVLVYSGPGTTPNSVKHAVESLRMMLSPHYAVTPVSETLLLEQPWEAKTAVLVIPGGADLPICGLFNGEMNARISTFVRKGGKYIGFCSGGYYGSARCEFEVGDPQMEVSGSRELKFFPGTCRGSAVKGYVYDSEEGARAMRLSVNQEILPKCAANVFAYHNGGGMFVNAHKYPNVEIIARFSDPIDVEDDDTESNVNAAVVVSTIGRGKALLSGPHIEFYPELLAPDCDLPEYKTMTQKLMSTDTDRLEFLRACLSRLGLKVNSVISKRPALTPLFLTSFHNSSCDLLVHDLVNNVEFENKVMDLGHDHFDLHEGIKDLYKFQLNPVEDPDTAVKHVYVCGENPPDKELTPYFDINRFQKFLKQFYTETGQGDHVNLTGSTFMYGEVLTSTSSLMDNNHRLLKYLPEGFTIFGSTQVLGKGRSGNHWVNPRGVLATSNLVKLPMRMTDRSPIVFFQYLSAMAYTRAILEYDTGYNMIPVKIKWPNDIYVMLPEYIGKKIDPKSQDVTHGKIGGILVNTNLIDKSYYLVVGAGLNVGNESSPTTSLNKVIDSMNTILGSQLPHFEYEKLLAKYLCIFNQMIEQFKLEGFKPFLHQYYSLWFHSNQMVTLHDKPGVKAQIIGITPEWGMLLVRELNPNGTPTGTVYELQPDGNSFDMFKGLISKKQ